MRYLTNRILQLLENECKLTDKAQIDNYIMSRKQNIIDTHVNTVCKIYCPGEAGSTRYFMTKLTPKDYGHQQKIYAKTREELEEKIIAYYLGIQNESKITLRETLISALGEDEKNLSKTGKRTLQRFDKNLSSLADIMIVQLNEKHIRSALEEFVAKKPSEKEFNETITPLNKIADYCNYEHIEVCNIREIISTYRKFRLTGKHIWTSTKKKTVDLAFTRAEASRIIRNALRVPNYKALAVAVLITTGLRVGELLGLELDDIYLEDGYLWIHQIEDTKTYEILDYVKENKSREVYLSDDAITVLKKCLEYRKTDPQDSTFLFLNENSKDGKMHLRAIDDYLREYIHKNILGYDNTKEARSPHDCRRTYASLEYLNGTRVDVLMAQLGHANVGQTWDYIKNVVEATERRSQLKGQGLILNVSENLNNGIKIAK